MELDVAARALLKLVLLPPGCLVAGLVIGLLLVRRRLGKLLLIASTTGLIVLSTPVTVEWLAARVETIPPTGMAQLKASEADAILVFMAGLRRDNPEYDGADVLTGLSLERLDHALRIQQQTGLPIIVSGGSVDGDTTPLAELALDWLRRYATATVIAAETDSRDTWENARFSKPLLADLGIERVVLVTHAFHMPRALYSAESAGIDAVPSAFAYLHPPPAYQPPRRPGDWLPQAGALHQAYLLLHEMAGYYWYRQARQ